MKFNHVTIFAISLLGAATISSAHAETQLIGRCLPAPKGPVLLMGNTRPQTGSDGSQILELSITREKSNEPFRLSAALVDAPMAVPTSKAKTLDFVDGDDEDYYANMPSWQATFDHTGDKNEIHGLALAQWHNFTAKDGSTLSLAEAANDVSLNGVVLSGAPFEAKFNKGGKEIEDRKMTCTIDKFLLTNALRSESASGLVRERTAPTPSFKIEADPLGAKNTTPTGDGAPDTSQQTGQKQKLGS